VDTPTLAARCRRFQESNLYFLYGSGSNQHAQLLLKEEEANASEEFVLVCAKPAGGAISRPIRVEAGGGHSALLTADGRLYLWGWNDNGQLGRAGTTRPYEETPPLSIRARAASLGHSHTLVLEEGSDRAYAFGDNGRGQCGAAPCPSLPPVLLLDEPCADVSAGLFHSAVVTAGGRCVAFGGGEHAAGLGSWKPQDSACARVACGRKHTLVLDDAGRVFAAGDDKYGQLGGGSSPAGADPRPVRGFLGRKDSGCVDVLCGWSHNIALVKRDGAIELYGWGRNDKGQLGIPTGGEHVREPTRIDLDDVRDARCGSEWTVFLKKDGSFWSCGWNEHGNLGNGSDVDSTLVVKMKGATIGSPPGFESPCGDVLFAAGGAHFYAIRI